MNAETPYPRSAPPPRFELDRLARHLQRRFQGHALKGRFQGRTRLRDALIHTFNVSTVEAEALVDQLHSRGFLVWHGGDSQSHLGSALWTIHSTPMTS